MNKIIVSLCLFSINTQLFSLKLMPYSDDLKIIDDSLKNEVKADISQSAFYPGFLMVFSSTNILSEEFQECPLYEKYKNKMSSDPGDAQVWSMCAGAALEACRPIAENVKKERLAYYTNLIKGMVTEGSPCPCCDVLLTSLWNGSKTTGSSNGTGFPQSTAYPEYNGNSGSSYKELLKQADEYYYSGDYGKALELYKAASKANGGSDSYLRDRIASLSQYTGKTIGSGTANSNKPKQDVNSYIENLIKNNPAGNSVSGLQTGNGDYLISQYKNLINDYLAAFRNSLSGSDYDLNILLEKTQQMEQFVLKYLGDENLFTPEQLEMISKITADFSDSMFAIAGTISFENEPAKRKYIEAKSPKIPFIQVPGAYAVDPNPKPNSSGYSAPLNSNTAPIPGGIAPPPDGDARGPLRIKKK